MELKNNKRMIYADILRIMATFAVIVTHVSGSRWYITPIASHEWNIFTMYNSLVRWAVPLFVMVSGMFLLDPAKIISIDDIFKKYVLRIFLALAFWGLLYGSASLAKNVATDRESLTAYSLVMIPAKIVFGPPWYHLWFLYTIISLYLLTPLLRVFTAFCSKRELEYSLLILIVFGRIIPLVNKMLGLLENPMIINLTMVEATGYISYFLAGFYLSKYELPKALRLNIYILAFISVMVTIGATRFTSVRAGIPTEYFYGNGLPTTMVISFAVFIFIRRIYEHEILSENINKKLVFVSECTFGIYLIHDLINQIFLILGLNTIFIDPLVGIPLLSALNFCLSFFCIAIIKKIPWLGTRIA